MVSGPRDMSAAMSADYVRGLLASSQVQAAPVLRRSASENQHGAIKHGVTEFPQHTVRLWMQAVR